MQRDELVEVPADLEGFRVAMREAGIEHIVETILMVFVEDSRGLVDSLQDSLAAGDAEAARVAAHTLKASAGNVRALVLSKLMAAIEAAAAVGDLAGAGALMDQALAEYSTVIDHMTREGYEA